MRCQCSPHSAPKIIWYVRNCLERRKIIEWIFHFVVHALARMCDALSSKRYHYLSLAESERCVHYYFRVTWHMPAVHCSWWTFKCEKYFIYENRWMGRSADYGLMRNDIVSHDLYKRSDVYRLDSALCSLAFLSEGNWTLNASAFRLKWATSIIQWDRNVSHIDALEIENRAGAAQANRCRVNDVDDDGIFVYTLSKRNSVIYAYPYIYAFLSRHILACSLACESVTGTQRQLFAKQKHICKTNGTRSERELARTHWCAMAPLLRVVPVCAAHTV